MMECVLVNVSQDNVELPKEKKVKRRFTKKFYFTSIIIVGFFVLRILDVFSTLVCLENIPGAREANPLAVNIVKEPGLWIIINLIVTGILFAVNIALVIFNRKNDITIKYIAMGFGVMMLILLIVCIWPVFNNFGLMVKYVEYL